MLLRKSYFSLRRCSNAHCAPLEANGDQFVLLKLLADQEGVTQQDLGQRAGYDANTTGSMLRAMEQQGLIIREPHPEDGRAKMVTLTDKGRQRQRELWDALENLRERLWACVREEDRDIVGQTLMRIAKEMENVRTEHEQKRNT